MTNWQTTVCGIIVWVFLWFVWKAGYGTGYKDAAQEWSSEDEDDGIPTFQWPVCAECGQGISVHRCTKGMWQSNCHCGFAWCRSPHEALYCTERPEHGEGTLPPDEPKKDPV